MSIRYVSVYKINKYWKTIIFTHSYNVLNMKHANNLILFLFEKCIFLIKRKRKYTVNSIPNL